MDQTGEARSSPREPTIREELEGFFRALGLLPDAVRTQHGDRQRMEKSLGSGTPVSDVEVKRPRTDGKLDAAEQVAEMLTDLFQSQDTFVISNAGVQAIIEGLLERYRASDSAPQREKLLVHWRQDLPRLRAALREAAKNDPLVLDTGQEVSLITTQKAEELLERICPRSPYLPNTRGTRNVR